MAFVTSCCGTLWHFGYDWCASRGVAFRFAYEVYGPHLFTPVFRHGSCNTPTHTLGMEFYSSTQQLQPQAATEAQFSSVCIANLFELCKWMHSKKCQVNDVVQNKHIYLYKKVRQLLKLSYNMQPYTRRVLSRNFVLLISILKLAQLNNYLVFFVVVVLYICEYDYYYLSDLT